MNRHELQARFCEVRAASESLCVPLGPEDCTVQSMPDASPTKWHLAHTAWFFETFVLRRALPEYRPINESYRTLFNSYYNAVGGAFPRAHRGALSRPTLVEALEYRRRVDEGVDCILRAAGERIFGDFAPVIELGIHHEQQHQELILTDIKHAFASNPLAPRYSGARPRGRAEAGPLRWVAFEGGLVEIGDREAGFAFDNERPSHREALEPFELASRPVTCGEYLEFVGDRGYARPELWLSDGWEARARNGWESPAYWTRQDGGWSVYTLSGPRAVDPLEPVCHVSYYEADAYARWAGARLPREAEWERAAQDRPIEGNFVESRRYHPAPGAPEGGLAQLFGDVWEWTSSAYLPYPGFKPPDGALGEYNGKFMCNQMVLRGGSCASPRSHLRATYRNFFPPEARWQFSGIRLAR